MNYRAGQGAITRLTARFVTGGVADSWQGAGLISIGDELSFGYNGTGFGCWYRSHGKAEIRTLTISTPAGGSENATLTLDGTPYTVPLTAGTAAHNTLEIANYVNANVTTCQAWQNDGTVVFTYLSDGPKSGAFTFTSGTAVGAFATITTGVLKTSTFIAQADWNIDTCDWLNPQLGNVYQIQFQYLGYGAITFSVEEPVSGEILPVHRIAYANSNTAPSLGNPSLRTGLYCVSLGSTTDIEVRSSSMSAFVQGNIEPVRNQRAVSNVKTAVGNTATNLLTIRNRAEVNGIINQVEVEPSQVTIFTESIKGATVDLRTQANVAGDPNFQYTGTNLVVEYDTAGTTVTNGTLIASYVIPGNSSQVIDLSKLNLRIPPTLALTISGRVNSGAAADIGAAIVYYEDV